MSEPTPPASTAALKGVRRITVIVIIVSLSVTAIIGIVTLLTASFGELQGKILLTTLLMAAFSITALCHLAVVGRALRVVGYVGIAVSALAFLAGALLIWRNWDEVEGAWDTLLKAFFVLTVLSASFAHANLLLLLGDRRSPVIRLGLFATVGLIALVALLLILPIVTEGDIPGPDGELYWRIFGVVAILDVLGTIVLPIIGRFVRDGGILTVRLDPDAAAKVVRIAAARSLRREAVVADAIARLEE